MNQDDTADLLSRIVLEHHNTMMFALFVSARDVLDLPVPNVHTCTWWIYMYPLVSLFPFLHRSDVCTNTSPQIDSVQFATSRILSVVEHEGWDSLSRHPNDRCSFIPVLELSAPNSKQVPRVFTCKHVAFGMGLYCPQLSRGCLYDPVHSERPSPRNIGPPIICGINQPFLVP